MHLTGLAILRALTSSTDLMELMALVLVTPSSILTPLGLPCTRILGGGDIRLQPSSPLLFIHQRIDGSQ